MVDEGLTKAGFDVVLPETRHVKTVLSAMIIKTDMKMRVAAFEVSRLAGCSCV